MAKLIETLVSKLGVNGINAEAVETNLFDHIIFDVHINASGELSFKELVDFYRINEYTDLSSGLQFAYELFGQFRNPKNAVNTLLHHMENYRQVDSDTFKNQAQYTPAEVTKDVTKNVRHFKGLLEICEAHNYDLSALEYIANAWAELNGYTGNAFTMFTDFYVTNASDGLERGTIVSLHDPLFSQEIYGKVLQASPNGFLTVYADDSDLLITSETAKTIKIVESFDSNRVTEAWQESFNNGFNEYIEDLQVARDMKIEKAIKTLDKVQAIQDKADKKKKATLEKANKVQASKELSRKLVATKPTTLEEIAEVRKQINQNADALVKTHKDALRRLLRMSTAKIKAENEANKKQEVAKAEVVAEEPKAEIVAEAVVATKKERRTSKKK